MIPPALVYMALIAGAKALERYSEEKARVQERRVRLERLQREQQEQEMRQALETQERARLERLEREHAARRAAEAHRREQRLKNPIADYLSYTRLRTFAECPHKFYLKYVLGRTGNEWRLRVASGKEFHSWIETQLKPYEGRSLPHSVLHAAPPAHRTRAQMLARGIVHGAQVVGIEHEVHYQIGDVTVKGFIDLLYRRPDGTLVICDIKTGRTPKIHIEQLEMYSLLLLQNEPHIRLEFQLVDTEEVVAWQITKQHHAILWDDLRTNADTIRRERIFAPIPGGHCGSCQFYDECADAGISRGKPSELKLVQLRTAKRGAKLRD